MRTVAAALAAAAGLVSTAAGAVVGAREDAAATAADESTSVLGGSLPSLDWSDVAPLQTTQYNNKQYGCKCYPGEACWPSAQKWTQLNSTVGGRLQVHIPPGAACHNTFQGPLGTVNTYDAAACANVKANWADESWT